MSDRTLKPLPGYVDVALEVPMRQLFTYSYNGPELEPGVRVSVPFGKRKLLGVVIAKREQPPDNIKLRPIKNTLDKEPLFSSRLIQLISWTAAYYHQPVGEVWRTAMPSVLRKGREQTHGLLEPVYCRKIIPGDWREQLRRAPVQLAIMEGFSDREGELTHADLLKSHPGCGAAIKALIKKNYLRHKQRLAPVKPVPGSEIPNRLTSEQENAYQVLSQKHPGFQCQVLEGITGSGKTEVYFALIDGCLSRNEQVLVLVPEIALTDQLFGRFTQRFGSRVVQVHSGMGDANRYRRWWEIRAGSVDVMLATRSGVFLEFKRLGLIIVDEEHDLSYKQQEGVRYHARSVAIKRAQIHDIPVVLGSATPALETVQNIKLGRYLHVQLLKRVGASRLPEIRLLDLNQVNTESGLSQPAIQALRETLEHKQQALVFINRRGYAPVLYCPACQWTAQCKRCDAQMTLHQNNHALLCHHCGAKRGVPLSCDACGEQDLITLGEGTQKVEENLKHHFPQANIQRFDRDELNTTQKLQQALDKVHAREVDILVGTQLLSKGHDFSKVSLVLVINADQGLHSIDFRAPELLVQQLIQVAGRAGRGEEKGRVLIQTYFPQHQSLLAVTQHAYAGFASKELEQRKLAEFPPYSHMVLWRARAQKAEDVMQFLESVAQHGRNIQPADTFCYDPVKSPMFKRGGQYHAQLLISAKQRAALHRWLGMWIERVERDKLARKVKWSIDVDPVSLF
jgi:primosomal protein N' (replication factor Y)